ncbi:MAG: hypothetical protein HY840_11440 [Bacteroidetes bacterium]|nr:hypothetical protein [Bacteroidota bacterium]
MKPYFALLFLFPGLFLQAQDEANLFRNILATDSATINTLFSYPDSIRSSILISSSYPQGFVRLSEVQKVSSGSFNKLLSKYDEKMRKQIWELSRYPDLITLLAENGKKTNAQIKKMIENYPEKIQNGALFLVNEDYDLIVKVNNLQNKFNNDIHGIVKDYPAEVHRAYQQVISFPEIVSSLSKNMRTTVAIGDLYKRNPNFIKQKADSVNSATAREKAKEAEDWKKNISSDTSAMNQLKTSSGKYQNDSGEGDEKFDQKEYNMIVTYHYRPYPYWFGCPSWYGFEYWYPYPWWYHSGFYFGLGGAMIIMGPPDYYFGHWYFNYPSHHYYYPHLSHQFYNHYEYHHRSSSGLNRSVREWESGNKDVSRDWLRNDSKRPERFRQYGQMEINRQQYNRQNPATRISRGDYLDRNVNKYPDIRSTPRPTRPVTPRQPQGSPEPKLINPQIRSGAPSQHRGNMPQKIGGGGQRPRK